MHHDEQKSLSAGNMRLLFETSRSSLANHDAYYAVIWTNNTPAMILQILFAYDDKEAEQTYVRTEAISRVGDNAVWSPLPTARRHDGSRRCAELAVGRVHVIAPPRNVTSIRSGLGCGYHGEPTENGLLQNPVSLSRPPQHHLSPHTTRYHGPRRQNTLHSRRQGTG